MTASALTRASIVAVLGVAWPGCVPETRVAPRDASLSADGTSTSEDAVDVAKVVDARRENPPDASRDGGAVDRDESTDRGFTSMDVPDGSDGSDAGAPGVDVVGAPDSARCPSEQTLCDGVCVSTSSAVDHCGRCGSACAPPSATGTCVAGQCRVASCSAGFGDCDGQAATGCEVELSSNARHCGSCGIVCNFPGAGAVCMGGTCQRTICATGLGDCDANTANGCETNLGASSQHCGACGNPCVLANATSSCNGGICGVSQCSTGFGNCDGNVANGCETGTTSSMLHCGQCGVVCTASRRCVGGRCEALPLSCPAGMRLIPAGEFTMGGEDLARYYPSIDYVRYHRVRLSAFCMDETEVTVAAYVQCPAGAGCTTPGTATSCNWSTTGPVPGREQHPINCVDWGQAVAYCRFRGGALPTEAQWEYAARGTDGRIYPWGSTPVPASQLCWSGGGVTQSSTCVVRSFPGGTSPFGLFDMAGNVWEMTADWFRAYPPDTGSPALDPTGSTDGTLRAVRGGAFVDSTAVLARPAARGWIMPTGREFTVGLRCIRNPS